MRTGQQLAACLVRVLGPVPTALPPQALSAALEKAGAAARSAGLHGAGLPAERAGALELQANALAAGLCTQRYFVQPPGHQGGGEPRPLSRPDDASRRAPLTAAPRL